MCHLHKSKSYKRFRYFVTMERINRIKEVLVIQGKSQVWLAEKLGKSTTAVAAMCNNRTQPHLKDLKKIAFVLDIDIRELLVPTK
jgi:putative transcriptional regulator